MPGGEECRRRRRQRRPRRRGAGRAKAQGRQVRRSRHALHLPHRSPVRRQPGGDYDHLARLWEWHVIGERRGRGRMSAPADPQLVASDPRGLGLRGRQRRFGQDLHPGHAGRPAAARGGEAGGDPLRHLHQGGGGGDADAACSAGSATGRSPDDDLRKAIWPISTRPAATSPPPAPSSPAPWRRPAGLKIQTLHAFCEQVLRRFPLEAGVRPGFEVADDAQAARAGRRRRGGARTTRLGRPRQPSSAEAYAHFSVELRLRDLRARCSTTSRARRGDLTAYFDDARRAVYAARHLAALRLRATTSRRSDGGRDALPAHPLGRVEPARRESAETGAKSSAKLGGERMPHGPGTSFPEASAIFFTQAGAPRSLERRGSIRAQVPGCRASRTGWLEIARAHARPRAWRENTRPRPHPRPRLHRPLPEREGAARPAGFRRPHRPRRAACSRRSRRRLGALQARRRHRARAARRGAGHRPGPVGHPPRAGRGVLQRRRRGARDPHRLHRRRRQAVDLFLPGRGAGAAGGGDRRLPRARARGAAPLPDRRS